MKTTEVENMTLEDLKAQRNALPDEVRECEDLAERYIQARLDAKQRDQRMAEQGEEITRKDAQIAQQFELIGGLLTEISNRDALIADLNKQLQEKAATDGN